MTIYVTGRGGNLDTVLVDVFGCRRLECDIDNKASIKKAISKINPDSINVLINCAAITNVDECETELRSKALHTNAAGIANLRDEFNGRIIHISTDYVFDGKSGPYDEKAEPNPINWYGQTKLCGEERLIEYNSPGDTIVRTTVLYGGRKPDFAITVLRKLAHSLTVEVPNTISGSPTHVFHLAKALMKLVSLELQPKIINIAGSDTITRYEFAIMLANAFGYNPEQVHPISNAPGIAKRPKNAGLKVGMAKRLGLPIYSVMDGINQLFVEKRSLYGKS